MGSVADKIAKKVLSARGSKVVDLAAWQEGRELALEAGFGGDSPILDKLADQDPCHAMYVMAQNIASVMCESISEMREAKTFCKIVCDAEDEYMPQGPPMSPLTVSYFTMWSMFDVRFGKSRETIGSCILRLAPVFDFPPWLTDTVERMQRSRMGFYVHCGNASEVVRLREVGTREIVSCIVPAGYVGTDGEIWFVRVLPPPHSQCRHHIVYNTPYVIRDYPERSFVDYMARELARMPAREKPSGRDDARDRLMKYGPDPNHWNKYIFCAFSNHQYDAVFLTGIPDIPPSLPYASLHR